MCRIFFLFLIIVSFCAAHGAMMKKNKKFCMSHRTQHWKLTASSVAYMCVCTVFSCFITFYVVHVMYVNFIFYIIHSTIIEILRQNSIAFRCKALFIPFSCQLRHYAHYLYIKTFRNIWIFLIILQDSIFLLCRIKKINTGETKGRFYHETFQSIK